MFFRPSVKLTLPKLQLFLYTCSLTQDIYAAYFPKLFIFINISFFTSMKKSRNLPFFPLKRPF